MDVESRFRERGREVSAYLRSLLALERVHRIPGRGFYKASEAIAASRASAFIMMYNCVEFGMREALVAIRQDIVSGSVGYSALGEHWQEEIVRAHFRDRLSQGTNYIAFLKDVAKFGVGAIGWKQEIQKLPFSGNIDNQSLLNFLEALDSNWKPPKSCLGGSDLVLVRQMRNDLAHGHETFAEVGSQFSTADLLAKFSRVRTFMASLIRVLERYREQKSYLR